MKEHPEDLLAGYVEGDLGERERTAVEEHLAACRRCSDEVALAGGARRALARLEEVPAPLGLATPAIQHARPRRRWSERLQVALGAGAAAALIAVGVAVVANGGANDAAVMEDSREAAGGADGGQGPAETGSPAQPLSSGPLYVSTDRDYSPDDLQALVRGEGESDVTAEMALDDAAVGEAESCVRRAGLEGETDAELIRVEIARYEGRPAYIVLFTTGDRDEVWAVGRERCQILYVATSQR